MPKATTKKVTKKTAKAKQPKAKPVWQYKEKLLAKQTHPRKREVIERVIDGEADETLYAEFGKHRTMEARVLVAAVDADPDMYLQEQKGICKTCGIN